MITRILMIATLLLFPACGSPEANEAPVAERKAKTPPSHPAAPPPPPAVAPAEEEGTCAAARLAPFIGRPFTAALAPAFRRQSGAASLRVQRPADTAPIDVALAPGRLNIILDPAGRIAEFSCG